MSNNIDDYWNVLYNLTQKAFIQDEVPVAALLVKDHQIIASAYNLVETLHDPTQHAEMIVLKEGFKIFGKYLIDCDIYVTLEPCPMCAHAIHLSKIRRLYFGAYDPKGGGIEHGPRCLKKLNSIKTFGGFHEQKFEHLLKDFFQKNR